MDREYAKVAKRLGLDPDKRRQHDLTDFPIERVRLSLSKYAVVLCVPCIAGYGWALQHHAVCIVASIMPLLVNLWSAYSTWRSRSSCSFASALRIRSTLQ